MNKKLIRLTESDLHRIVKESVKRVLRESYLNNGMVKTLYRITKQQPNGLLNLSDMNIWINNSDGEGEDMEASAIGFNKGVFGVYVGYDDFFSFDELSDDEIEMIYDNVINGNN